MVGPCCREITPNNTMHLTAGRGDEREPWAQSRKMRIYGDFRNRGGGSKGSSSSLLLSRPRACPRPWWPALPVPFALQAAAQDSSSVKSHAGPWSQLSRPGRKGRRHTCVRSTPYISVRFRTYGLSQAVRVMITRAKGDHLFGS